jgi:Ion channel
VERLHELGYTNLRHYRGGIADWTEARGPVESQTGPTSMAGPMAALVDAPQVRPRSRPMSVPRQRQWESILLDVVERQSTSQLFLAYLAMIVLCGGVYWLVGLSPHHGLSAGGIPVEMNLRGLATAIYFSFVTATSVGYGDVVPVGAVRILAVAEAVTGLLIFGAVIAKFVSRRQDEIVREIQRVTFEERLDRVQTNLHLVLSELQAIAMMCDDGTCRPERISARLESAALVFAGELRAIHALLYRPHQTPEEAVLEAILASLAASLRELCELLGYLPAGFSRSPMLETTLKTLARLADEICGECVPKVYAPALTVWMDRIQEVARKIA